MNAAETNDIKYEYKALKNGDQISFSIEVPRLRNALQACIEAQIKAQ
jgi:hypothetical protein